MPAKKKSIVKKLIIIILVIAVVGAVGYAAYQKRDSLKKTNDSTIPLFTVESGHLLISVTASGTIKAQDTIKAMLMITMAAGIVALALGSDIIPRLLETH